MVGSTLCYTSITERTEASKTDLNTATMHINDADRARLLCESAMGSSRCLPDTARASDFYLEPGISSSLRVSGQESGLGRPVQGLYHPRVAEAACGTRSIAGSGLESQQGWLADCTFNTLQPHRWQVAPVTKGGLSLGASLLSLDGLRVQRGSLRFARDFDRFSPCLLLKKRGNGMLVPARGS
jgi:hypothetical protein